MRTPDKEITEALWEQIGGEFEIVADSMPRIKPKERAAFFLKSLKLAYTMGVERGYDMAAEVFDPNGGESDQDPDRTI